MEKGKTPNDFANSKEYYEEIQRSYRRIKKYIQEHPNENFEIDVVNDSHNIVGVSNFVLPVYSSYNEDSITTALWFFDS